MEREINGKTYTFQMTRKSLRQAERAGLRMSAVGDTPMDSTYFLWYAALSGAQPMQITKADDLLDTYLESADCPESFTDIFSSLLEEYNDVFGVAAE